MKYITQHYLSSQTKYCNKIWGQYSILDKLESKMNTCVLDKSRVEKRKFVAKELKEPLVV